MEVGLAMKIKFARQLGAVGTMERVSDLNEVHLDSYSIPVMSLKSCVIWATYLSLIYKIEIIIDLLINFNCPSLSLSSFPLLANLNFMILHYL